MPRSAVEDNKRLQIRMAPENKAKIARAAALVHMDLTQFITQIALREASVVIEREETFQVSERDFARVLELLEHPPAPNTKLKAAIDALPDDL